MALQPESRWTQPGQGWGRTAGVDAAAIDAGLRAFLVEFGVLGIFAGILAALAGTAAAWGVVVGIMRQEWVFLPGTLALTVAGCMLLVLAFGYAGTAMALRVRPAPLLRNE